MTESCACGTIMDSDEISLGSAGPPLQGVQIQLVNWDEGNYTVNDQPNPRGEIVIGGKDFLKICLFKIFKIPLSFRSLF